MIKNAKLDPEIEGLKSRLCELTGHEEWDDFLSATNNFDDPANCNAIEQLTRAVIAKLIAERDVTGDTTSPEIDTLQLMLKTLEDERRA